MLSPMGGGVWFCGEVDSLGLFARPSLTLPMNSSILIFRSLPTAMVLTVTFAVAWRWIDDFRTGESAYADVGCTLSLGAFGSIAIALYCTTRRGLHYSGRLTSSG